MACKEINLKYKTSNKTYSHSIRVQPTGTISLKAKMVAKGSEMTQQLLLQLRMDFNQMSKMRRKILKVKI